MKYPTISVVVATHNGDKTLDACLKSVRSQKYPQKKIEIIVVDGASKDKTLSIAKKYADEIIHIDQAKQNAEYNKGVGVRRAKRELLLLIDHDNVLPHDLWLSKMIKPLLDNKNIIGVETLRYHYNPKASLLDRYFALFGAGDPLAFYLGKSDRLSFLYDTYNLLGKAQDTNDYYIVRFSSNKIPTLGANGFLIRRKVLMENALVDEDNFFHIDVNVDLIKKSFNTYAFVKDDIIHLTGYKSIGSFLYRRKLFMEQFYIKSRDNRRYGIYEPRDKVKLILFILYSVTFIKPFYDAMRGYIRVPDMAWFLHPFLCFMLFVIYSSVTIKTTVKSYAR